MAYKQLILLFHLAMICGANCALQTNSTVNLLPDMFNLAVPDVLKNIDTTTNSFEKRVFFTKDQRLAAAEKSDAALNNIRKESARNCDYANNAIKKLSTELNNLLQENDNLSDEFVNKKKQLLANRIQINQEIVETWKLIESSVELNNIYLKSHIESEADLQTKNATVSFYIDDLFKIEEKIDGIYEHIKLAKSKKEKLLRLINSSYEQILYNKKKLEGLLVKKQQLLSSDPTLVDSVVLRERNEELTIKISIMMDQIKLQELKLKRLNIETLNLEDEIAINTQNKKETESLLDFAKANLFIATKDLSQAETRLEETKKQAVQTRSTNQQIIEQKKIEKLRLEEEIERIEASLNGLTLKENLNKKAYLEQTNAFITLSERKRQAQISAYEIGILEHSNDVEDLKCYEQQFRVRNIAMRLCAKGGLTEVARNMQLLREDKVQIESNLRNFDAHCDLDNSAEEINITKSQIKLKIEEIVERVREHKSNSTELLEAKSLLEKELDELSGPSMHQAFTRYSSLHFEIQMRYKQLKHKYAALIKEMAEVAGEKEIFARSAHAISLQDVVYSVQEAEKFFVHIFWSIQEKISPVFLIQQALQINLNFLLFLLSIILLLLLCWIILHLAIPPVQRQLNSLLTSKSTIYSYSLSWISVLGIMTFLVEHLHIIAAWSAIHIAIKFNLLRLLPFGPTTIAPQICVIFYLLSIPLCAYLCTLFLNHITYIIHKVSYFAFNEKTFPKNILLANILLYAGAIILPLRQSLAYFGHADSRLPIVLLAALSLIIEGVALLFFDKETLLNLMPVWGDKTSWLKEKLAKYYYPLFAFIGTIVVLYNPYVGYFNLAWKLILLVPLSSALIWLLIYVHEYLRKNILQLFIIEDEDGAQDRFEHAKLLYVFLVISLFSLLAIAGLFLISRMWGFSYTIEQLWQAVSSRWILQTQDGEVFGVIQIFQFIAILISGFFCASLFTNVILNRLFDAFDAEPGLQNTISRITQYLIIFLFAIIGLSSIGFAKFVVPTLAALIFGIALAIKDQASDIAAGIFILLERQFEIGHFIELPQNQSKNSERIIGTVHKISFRSTVIRTARNFFIAIPNRIMISQPIINWGMGKLAIGMEITVEVEYKNDPEQVRAIILSVLEAHPMILKVPAPIIRLDELKHSGALFFARAFFTGRRVREIWNLASDVRVGILNAFKENHIRIAYPQRVVNLLHDAKNPFDPQEEGVNISFVTPETNTDLPDETPHTKR